MLEFPQYRGKILLSKHLGQMKLIQRHVILFDLASKVNIQNLILKFQTLYVAKVCSLNQGQAVRWAKNLYNYLKELNLGHYAQEPKTELEVDNRR